MESILLLEDDTDFCEDVTLVLRDQGYHVTPTHGAAEALSAAGEKPFHLILSDVRMAGPDDGVSVVEQIKQRQPFIRSILMTGYATLDVPIRAARIRADDYLRKPFELDALVSSVQALLEQETPFRGFLSTLREGSGAAEQPASWLFDVHLDRLEKVRRLCLKRFYLLIRSNRHSPRELYPFFCLWERLELEYIKSREAFQWDSLADKYARLEDFLIEFKPLDENSQSLTAAMFSQLYAKVQAGTIESCHLERAVELLHQDTPPADLESWCTYHWMWSEQLPEPDPFEGLTVSRYTLGRRRSTNNAYARLYEASPRSGWRSSGCAKNWPSNSTRESKQLAASDRSGCGQFLASGVGKSSRGDVALCLPADQTSFAFVRNELQTGLCRLLQETRGHFVLLYPGESHSLARRIPPTGCSPAQAWTVLRPVFQQVDQYHRKGRCCGLFGPGSVEIVADQPPRLRRFDRQAFAQRSAELQAQSNFFCPLAAPEIRSQALPTPLSDQYCLGRILFRTVLGQPAQSFPVHLFLSLGTPAAEEAWRHVAPSLGPLAEPIHRLCHSDPAQRYPDLREAARHLDSVVR